MQGANSQILDLLSVTKGKRGLALYSLLCSGLYHIAASYQSQAKANEGRRLDLAEIFDKVFNSWSIQAAMHIS